MLVAQDFGADPLLGGTPWSWPTRSVMGAFGLTDENNMALDGVHNEGDASRIRFEAGRNFGAHPVVSGLSAISVSATCTFADPWPVVVATDTDTVPPSRPVVVEQSVGAGRVLALGDSNVLTYSPNSAVRRAPQICDEYGDTELELLADFLRRMTDAGRRATDGWPVTEPRRGGAAWGPRIAAWTPWTS